MNETTNAETIVEEIVKEESRALAPISKGDVRIERISDAIQDLKALRTFITAEMIPDIDYGVIPGTSGRKNLLLPGAQKVLMYFNSYPRYRIKRRELMKGHLEVAITCEIISRQTDEIVGTGVGSCTSMESKYRFRKGARACPKCHKEGTIIKGKPEYAKKDGPGYEKGGWLCFQKKDGCGAKFKDDDPEISSQSVDKVEVEDAWDQRNTVLKIGKKRALVDAAIGLGCLSEFFTQDLEELDTFDRNHMSEQAPIPPPAPPAAPPPAAAAPQQATLPTSGEAPGPKEAGPLLLAGTAEQLSKARGCREILHIHNVGEASAKRLGVYDSFRELVNSYFEFEKVKGEPLVPVPAASGMHELEFRALDEAVMKGDVNGARAIFRDNRSRMESQGLGPQWRSYAVETAKVFEGRGDE
jgi:hypothetical protein